MRHRTRTRRPDPDSELSPLLPALTTEAPLPPPTIPLPTISFGGDRRTIQRQVGESEADWSSRLRATVRAVIHSPVSQRRTATPPPPADSVIASARRRIAVLTRGASQTTRRLSDDTAFQIFTVTTNVEVVERLIEAGYARENWLFVALFKRDRNLMILKRLLDRFGGGVTDRYRRNLFGYLVVFFDKFSSWSDAERTLLLTRLAEAKVDPNHRDSDCWTPLERLVVQHRFGVVRSWLIGWMIGHGADPNGGPEVDQRGGPIFRAIGRAGTHGTTGEIIACAATLDELIRHGADPKVTTRHGRNPVTVALNTLGELTVADHLVRKHGVKPKLLDTEGRNVLFADLWTGGALLLRDQISWDWLRTHRVPFDVPDLVGATPFDHLLLKPSDWHLSFATWLVDYGVSPITPMSNGARPIDYLREHGGYEYISHHPRVRAYRWIERRTARPDLPAEKECPVCLVAPRSELIQLQPCRHRCICLACLVDLKAKTPSSEARCPICRTAIASLVRPTPSE